MTAAIDEGTARAGAEIQALLHPEVKSCSPSDFIGMAQAQRQWKCCRCRSLLKAVSCSCTCTHRRCKKCPVGDMPQSSPITSATTQVKVSHGSVPKAPYSLPDSDPKALQGESFNVCDFAQTSRHGRPLTERLVGTPKKAPLRGHIKPSDPAKTPDKLVQLGNAPSPQVQVPSTGFSNTRRGREAFSIKPKQGLKSPTSADSLEIARKSTPGDLKYKTLKKPDWTSSSMKSEKETDAVLKIQPCGIGGTNMSQRILRDAPYSVDRSSERMKASLPLQIFPKLPNVTQFGIIWETRVLPLLDRELPQMIGHSELTIDVLREPDSRSTGKSKSPPSDPLIRRVIHVSCPFEINVSCHETIRNMTREALADFSSTTVCKFHTGKVRRCCDCCGSSEDDPDKSCSPKRVHYQPRPVMGASIGLDKSTFAGTLGGYLVIDGVKYVSMTCSHVLEYENGEDCDVVNQPASGDSNDPTQPSEFGRLQYASNSDRTRESTVAGADGKRVECIMDWAIVRATRQRAGTNIAIEDDEITDVIESETFDEEHQQVRTMYPSVISCGDICEPREGMLVHITGRTSGFNFARITEGRSSVHHPNSRVTKEWGLEIINPSQKDDDEHKRWILSGPGQQGDSGAWVVDADTKKVCGMIFARGPVYGTQQRIAYFSSMNDIILDVKGTIAFYNSGLEPDDIDIRIVKPEIFSISSPTHSITDGVGRADAVNERRNADLTGLTNTSPTVIRRARALAMNCIPLTSGAPSSFKWVMPVM